MPTSAAPHRLRAGFQIVRTLDAIFLRAETRERWWQDAAAAEIITLLSERPSTFDEILARFGGRYGADSIRRIWRDVERGGFLVQDGEPLPAGTPPEAAFWESRGVPWSVARARLEGVRVAVTNLGSGPATLLERALAENGFLVSAAAQLEIIVADDYCDERLAEINRRKLAEGSRWVVVKPAGDCAMLGPLFIPRVTACWECLRQRLVGHRRIDRYFARVAGGENTRAGNPGLPAAEMAAAHLLALELRKSIVEAHAPPLAGKVWTFDAHTLAFASHDVVRRPQCPRCSGIDYGAPRIPAPPALELEKSARPNPLDEALRRPEETIRRLRPLVDPVVGIIHDVRRITEPASDLAASFSAGHNFALISEDLAMLRRGMRALAGGKGRSPLHAEAGALAEAVERYCGVYDGTEIERQASFEELGPEALHPGHCLLYSERQYAAREEINRSSPLRERVSARLDPERQIKWAPVWSLTHGTFRLLPSALCYYGHPDAERHRYFWANSNGNASGPTLEAAALQGLMELIERDAVAIWWFNRLVRPGIDLTRCADPYVARLVSYYRELKREIWALDLTHDLGVPVVAALSRALDRPHEDIIYGFGAHWDPEVALVRALTEVNQSLSMVCRKKKDGSTRYSMPIDGGLQWWREVTCASQPYLAANPALPARPAAALPGRKFDSTREALRALVSGLEQRGFDVMMLDQTRPDIGFPVVKMIVPGLRLFWRRFAPGRLYDVPVQLGWLNQPCAENDLNPWTIYF